MLLGIILFIAVAVAFAFFVLSITFLRGQIGGLLPTEIALEIQGDLQMLLIWQMVALVVLSIILAVSIFFIVGELLAKPLKRIVEAMDAYAATGEAQPITDLESAPSEIRSLSTSFEKLTVTVGQAHKRDVEISRMKSDFISTAAHQFRTPLTGIRWALEALHKETLTDHQRSLTEDAMQKSKDLVGIVGTLLDISSIESGKYQYKFVPTDLHALVEEVAADFEALAKEHQVSLFYAHEDIVSLPKAKADQERIKWVLNNLVENAIQYTPAGGTVRLSIDPSDDRIFIRVRDSGIGIGQNDRANIFERFYRASNAVSKENQGNGLGLYIARRIATDHKGDLNFAPNEEGPGTTFILSLPMA